MHKLRLLPPQRGVFFSGQDHKYFYGSGPEAIEVPSSSHIIALGGGKDFDKTPWRRSLYKAGVNAEDAEYYMDRVRDIRAAIGTRFHSFAELSLCSPDPGRSPYEDPTGIPEREDAEALLIRDQWLKHVLPRIGKVYVIEDPMIHPGGCYGFTPDLIAEVDGILTQCDWKTNQAESYRERFGWLSTYCDDLRMYRICEKVLQAKLATGESRDVTARVREGWQMQQGSYAFGVEAVHGMRVQRGINFMLSVDGVKEKHWNRPDLDQGWLQFANGLLLHHQRAVMAGGHPVFQAALNALYPLMRH
jgi:hypothetical protein